MPLYEQGHTVFWKYGVLSWGWVIAKDCRCHIIPLLIQRCQFLSFSNTLYSTSALRLVTPSKCEMSLRFLKAHGGHGGKQWKWSEIVNKPSLRCGVQVDRCITLVAEGFTYYCEDDEGNIPRSSSVRGFDSFSCLSSVKYRRIIFVTVFPQFSDTMDRKGLVLTTVVNGDLKQ